LAVAVACRAALGHGRAVSFRVERLVQVTLSSAEPDRLAEFYRETLGFPLDVEGDPEAGTFRCQVGDTSFGIAPLADGEAPSGEVVLAIAVADLDAYVSALAQAGVALVAPLREDGGVRVALVRDPDGNAIELCEREGAVLGALEIAVRPRAGGLS
jgi:predicted enzyme related to lactoylglutathione lyase